MVGGQTNEIAILNGFVLIVDDTYVRVSLSNATVARFLKKSLQVLPKQLLFWSTTTFNTNTHTSFF
jgi:hypothetical protein